MSEVIPEKCQMFLDSSRCGPIDYVIAWRWHDDEGKTHLELSFYCRDCAGETIANLRPADMLSLHKIADFRAKIQPVST